MGTKEPVPVYQKPVKNERIDKLKKAFNDNFSKDPEFYVKVPGRVNLIGEHIDYCGYGVCPMALEQNMLLAVSKEDTSVIKIRNIDGQKYQPKDIETDTGIEIGEGPPQWFQYVLCGIKGVLEAMPSSTAIKNNGMNIVVSGNVPLRAGLSSSSALVSASALATAFAREFFLPKKEIADLCAKSERHIGTEGGGMDQAIAFLATEGCAKFIEFFPLRSTDVKLPEGATFVIAHSLVEKNKAASSDFNCRVVECRLAAQVLAKLMILEWRKMKKLVDLQAAPACDLLSVLHVVQTKLHDEPYAKSEVFSILETDQREMEELTLTANTRNVETFKLKQRAQHVFSEADRVRQFSEACATLQGEEALITLGRLMNASHDSLRDLYECSHPQLDELVELSRKLTYGTRLTGAGWGGCVVSLLSSDKVDEYIHTVKEEFYSKYARNCEFNIDSVVFSTKPNACACVYR